MSARIHSTRSEIRLAQKAKRSVYIELDERIARVIDRGAKDLGESRSAFLGRILQTVFPAYASEIEATRPLR